MSAERGRKRTPKRGPHLVTAESNLEINPIFKPTGRGVDATPYTFERVVQAEDGIQLQKVWRVEPSPKYGAPRGRDQDVFMALMDLLARRGGMPENGVVETSFAQLLHILKWPDNGNHYSRLKESLLRVDRTIIESREAFYSKDTESSFSGSFRLWEVRFAESKRKSDGRTSTRIVVEFHELVVRSFLAHYFKGLDMEFYWKLSSHLSKRLYRLVDQMREDDLEWSENLFKLRDQIPVSQYAYVSKIKQVLDPAHKELKEKGFLEAVRYEDDKVCYRIGAGFARRRSALEASDSPEAFIATERLLAEGVHFNVAKELVAKNGARRCLRYAEAVNFQEGVRNRAGWLKKAIEQGYELPEARPRRGGVLDAQEATQPPLREASDREGASARRREGYEWLFGE